MPLSVIVVGDAPNLFSSVCAALRSDARFVEAEDVLHCDGLSAPLTNIYPIESTSVAWNDWQSGDSRMPDPRSMSALLFETRSVAWVAEVGALLADRMERPVWFVDAFDVAWPSDAVDVDRIALG